VKLCSHFADFLRDTVNLNQSRIDTLEDSVEAIQAFIKGSDWEPRVWKFVAQGSWAHETIIKPVNRVEFDADLLVVIDPVEGWTAADYVRTLGTVFAGSGVYKDKAKVWDYCVTISYAGDRKIDIAPCVRGRLVKDRLEVCNRPGDEFERTEPVAYTDWIKEKNGYSGGNSFRKVTRLIKYLRNIRREFECPSVVLTTLLAEQIHWNDKGSDGFKDVPSSLKSVFGRLDDWLRVRPVKPPICNPHLAGEDFAAAMTQEQYAAFRTVIERLRGLIDEAFETEGIENSLAAWRKVFGDEFGKGAMITAKAELDESEVLVRAMITTTAHHHDNLVDQIRKFGRWIWSPKQDRPPHLRMPPWQRADVVSDQVRISAEWRQSQHHPESRRIRDFDELPRRGGLWFDVTVNAGEAIPPGHYVRWRITNTGAMALAIGAGRGGFESPTLVHKRWEGLQYRGVHLAEAFVIRASDDRLVGQSAPFHVMIV